MKLVLLGGGEGIMFHKVGTMAEKAYFLRCTKCRSLADFACSMLILPALMGLADITIPQIAQSNAMKDFKG